MVQAVIVGTGNLAHGLAHLFQINNSIISDNTLEVTKEHIGLKKGEHMQFHDTRIPVSEFEDAIDRADIVILAIPSHAVSSFLHYHQSKFLNKEGSNNKTKIIVDATNSNIPILRDDQSYKLVKAFNDVGAVDILLRKPEGKKKIPTKMCSPHVQALKEVKKFAEKSMGFDVKIVPYEEFSSIAMHQNSLGGKGWRDATITMIVVFVLCQTYNIIRHPIAKGYPWYSFPLFCMNKGVSWTALTGFAIAQVPGILARAYNATYKDTLCSKPKWMIKFIEIRKYVGLVSLWFLSVHILMSCLMFGPNYYDRFFVDRTDPMSRMTLNGEMSFMMGAFGAGLYLILGICSLPSIAEHMTNQQWQLVYGPIAWIALFLGTGHVVWQGAGVTWQEGVKGWPWGMPPITLISVIIPIFVIGLKIFQMLYVRIMPCITKKVIDYDALRKSTRTPSKEESDVSSSDSSSSNKDIVLSDENIEAIA